MAKKYRGSRVKTKIGDLSFVMITDEGLDTSMAGQEPNMKYIAVMECEENGEVHKQMLAQVDAEWARYCTEFGVKGRPAKNKYGTPMTGISPKMIQDDADIDPETGEGTWKPTGKVNITFKTNTTWPDGKPIVVKVFDSKGAELNERLKAAGQSIGSGSRGVIHGTAQGNNAGDAHKVTLYLTAVQLAKFVPYDGTNVEVDEIEGEDIEINSDAPVALDEDVEV